ncbi:autotransporter domain-containing protein [Fusobacterium polymorphum]|uniref:Autotransporter subunit beta n=1 Tax=Fusobacterium nucleatum subsp. polymorphum TaxID=76857 RepID=A0A2C6BUD6_FUSNP|nr:autotransporter outer membrane beta-barrel domain-containing protein [Fusobacterium polymorphum]PHI07833.1 autotransporter subunit beta [Fusobacterium polymorphum]
MKKNMLMLMMLIAISSYSNINMSKEPHYKVPLTNEFVEAIEQKGYNDFLRIVDEQNRKIGIYSNYTNKANKKTNRLHDDVDLVPVAHVVDSSDGNDWKYQLEGLKTPVPDSDASRNFQRTENLITKGAKSIDNESLERMGYQRSGYQNRFYLGNGNTVKDIIYLNKDNFSKEVQKAKDTNNDRFLIEGAYKSIGSRNDEPDTYPNEKETNILGIKVDATKNAKGEYTDEYYAKIQGKSRKEVAAFLKSKMEEKGITGIIQKGDELYTKDSKGNEWKVLWSLEPISLHKSSAPENERFKDTVFTRIYTYNEFDDNSTTDSAGKKLYTKDGSIYLQDKYDYSPELFLKDGWGEPKKLSDKIAEAKENIDNGELPNNTFEHYFYDKKNMTETAFNAKWVTPFENGDFDRDLENLRKEVKEAKERLAPIEKVYNEAKEKTKAALNDPDWPEGVYWWTLKYMSEADFETFLSTKTEKEKALLKEWKKYSAIEEEKFTEITNLNTDIQENIPKKYGFYKSYWSGSPADEKWLDRVLQDSKIIRNLLGKNIQFRGRGRIEGTIDLGEGSNQIEIEEQFTGRYGTNVILGPYAKIINVKRVWVGGQLGSDSGVSISGRASLSLDIDSTKKNDEGNYYQHALKDSDPNILFMSRFGAITLEQRNQFQIEMMISRITEDGSIDIGRKVDYKYTDIGTGKQYDMTIPFISDSIAHSLVDNKKFSKNGTSLLDVKIKDEIKRLSSEENTVYKSIKNAKKLSVLADTLTTTNKKTTFSVADEEKNEEKLINLAFYLKNKEADKLLNDLSQFNLSTTEKEEMKKLIQNIKDSETVQNNIKKENNLNDKLKIAEKLEKTSEYKSLNLTSFLTDINSFNINDLREKRDDKSVRNENTKKIKDIVNKIDITTLEKLKNDYPELNFDEVLTAVNNVKNQDVVDKWDFGFLLSKLETLQTATKKQLDYTVKNLTESLANINKELYKELEGYRTNISNDYQNLKGKIYYTMREEEVLSELKNMLNQLSDRNIYSKLNKISKNEISTYTTIPFEVTHALTDKKSIAKGGFISNRTVQDNFKGNIYTAYGLYETTASSDTKYGFLFGGANTKHNEVYQRSLTTVATESEIKGVSAYVGGYFNKPIVNNLNWITGIGSQYGRYKVKREMRNNYQDLHSEGKVNTTSLNTYSGFIINYPIQEDVFVQLKGLLAYTMVKQSKVNESGDLPLDINGKTYHYVDGEAGISFNKIFYGEDLRSSISAGAYGILGITGYKNRNLEGKIDGSSSSFGIKGDRVKKDAVKIHLDYNVQTDAGYTYGLEGTYISNSKENNIKIGIKGGYVF